MIFETKGETESVRQEEKDGIMRGDNNRGRESDGRKGGTEEEEGGE